MGATAAGRTSCCVPLSVFYYYIRMHSHAQMTVVVFVVCFSFAATFLGKRRYLLRVPEVKIYKNFNFSFNLK